jgi:hypothetical protein
MGMARVAVRGGCHDLIVKAERRLPVAQRRSERKWIDGERCCWVRVPHRDRGRVCDPRRCGSDGGPHGRDQVEADPRAATDRPRAHVPADRAARVRLSSLLHGAASSIRGRGRATCLNRWRRAGRLTSAVAFAASGLAPHDPGSTVSSRNTADTVFFCTAADVGLAGVGSLRLANRRRNRPKSSCCGAQPQGLRSMMEAAGIEPGSGSVDSTPLPARCQSSAGQETEPATAGFVSGFGRFL